MIYGYHEGLATHKLLQKWLFAILFPYCICVYIALIGWKMDYKLHVDFQHICDLYVSIKHKCTTYVIPASNITNEWLHLLHIVHKYLYQYDFIRIPIFHKMLLGLTEAPLNVSKYFSTSSRKFANYKLMLETLLNTKPQIKRFVIMSPCIPSKPPIVRPC